MPRIYEAAAQRATGTAAGYVYSVTTGTRRAAILELGVFVASAPATGPDIGLGRGGGTAITVSLAALGQAMDPADTDAATTQLSTWATGPTVPGTAMRRITLPNVIGSGVIWTWAPGDFLVPPSTTTTTAPVIWQYSALAVTYNVYVKVLE